MIFRILKKIIKFIVPSPFYTYLTHRYHHWWSHNPFLSNSYYYRGLYDNLNRQKNVHKKILGVWDFNRQTGTLGDAIIFQEILNVLRCLHGLAEDDSRNIDICYVDDIRHPNAEDPRFRKTYEWKQTLKSTHRCNPYVSSVYEFATNADFDQFIAKYQDEYLMWPGGNVAYDRRIIHHFFEEHKFIPRLSCHPEVINWALDFTEKHVAPSLPIVVQIRKNTRDTERNTDIEILHDFLRSHQAADRYRFIIICHEDEIDERLEKLDNVIFAKRHNTNLEQDMALIQVAHACIFPTSGMYVFGIFSGVPCLQFAVKYISTAPFKGISEKHPSFNFNSDYQRMFIEKENLDLLKTEFESLMSDLAKAGWRNPEQQKSIAKAEASF